MEEMVRLLDLPSTPFPGTFQTVGSKPFPWSPKLQGPFHAGFMATDSWLLWAPRHCQPPSPGWCPPVPQKRYGK